MGEQVNQIINALLELESNIDSINESVLNMQNDLKTLTSKEIIKLTELTRQLATKEANEIISNAKNEAKLKSDEIIKTSNDNIQKIKNNIENNFEQAVNDIVKLILTNI